MDGIQWVPLMEHSPTMGVFGSRLLIDGAQMEMLLVEGELVAADIPAVFDPRRPGESFANEAIDTPVRLMVREIDLTRARQVRDEALGDGQG